MNLHTLEVGTVHMLCALCKPKQAKGLILMENINSTSWLCILMNEYDYMRCNCFYDIG